MRFGVQLYPWSRWPDLASIGTVAGAADDLGYHSVVFSEHLVTPLAGEEPPIGRVWPEIYVLAAYLAASTTNVRFVFYATVVPYRHPIHQASQIATLDQVSGGRLTIVAGIGWLREEFDALGVPFAQRGERSDEYIRAMRALWTGDEVAFDGRYVSFEAVAQELRCVQLPHVPIWIGGVGPHVSRRIIEFGSGWAAPIPWPIDKLESQVRRIKNAVHAAGRDVDAHAFAAGLSFGAPDPTALEAFSHVGSQVTPDWIAESADDAVALVERYRQAGFTDLVVSTEWTTPDDYLHKLEWFADNVMGRVDTD